MKRSITERGTLLLSGEDNDPASPTVGSGVVLARRPLTADEMTANASFRARVLAAPVNPAPGQESYGDAWRAWDAWRDALPIQPAPR